MVDGALPTLLAEDIFSEKNLIKSVSLANDGSYRKAEKAYDGLRERLYERAYEIGEEEAIDEIMPEMRKMMHIDREVEIISVLAQSMKSNPGVPHVLIFGAAHEFSQFLEGITTVDFQIAEGFSERPGRDMMQATDDDYEDFLSSYDNPLNSI